MLPREKRFADDGGLEEDGEDDYHGGDIGTGEEGIEGAGWGGGRVVVDGGGEGLAGGCEVEGGFFGAGVDGEEVKGGREGFNCGEVSFCGEDACTEDGDTSHFERLGGEYWS